LIIIHVIDSELSITEFKSQLICISNNK